MKSHMERRNYKEVIAKFLSVICQKDHDQAKATNQQIPNNPNLKTKREQIFEELNQMIAYMKRLEFEIKRLLDTPVKMFKILLSKVKFYSNQVQNPNIAMQLVKDQYLSEDMKQDDFGKIIKFANQLSLNFPLDIDSPGMQNLNVTDFINALQLLEHQKQGQIYKELMQMPLIRENFEEIQPFDISEFKEYLEKVRKLHLKVRQIYDFPSYEMDPLNSLKTRDI